MKQILNFFKWLLYIVQSKNGKGHGVHSPYAFSFIENCALDKRLFYAFAEYPLLAANKYNRLLFNSLHFYKPSTVVFDGFFSASDIQFFAAAVNPETIFYLTEAQMKTIKPSPSVRYCVYQSIHHISIANNTWLLLQQHIYQQLLPLNNIQNVVYCIWYQQPLVNFTTITTNQQLFYCYIHLFQIGLVAYRKEQLQNEYFSIRY